MNIIRESIKSQLSSFLGKFVQKQTQNKVIAGPFKGMTYVKHAVGSAFSPKLLGIYERELNHVIEEIIEADFDYIIDIGAAEGYYAIGLALRINNCKVYAFEMENKGRVLLAEMANLNKVEDRIFINGKCETSNLSNLMSILPAQAKTVVICDVEGYETELLQIERIPQLIYSYILIELHELMQPGTTKMLESRFQKTHEIEKFNFKDDHSIKDLPYRNFVTERFPKRYLVKWTVSELRTDGMSWLWMKPKKN
ncbi:hypothetical protein [Myxosarcina sp. GI1]|uniref:hypothetical protein n=1 Tax=Myxosarcina sp. GI1 TaxID=1541065 RepID=UPI000561B012|nr:hypothetical protein [Myxosarcina sp. GI1]